MDGWLVAILIAVAVLAIDQAALAAERRGWIRWRRSPPSRSSVSTAMLSVQALFEPDRTHVITQRAHDELDIDVVDDDEPLHPRGRAPSNDDPDESNTAGAGT